MAIPSKVQKEIVYNPEYKHYLALYQGDIIADFINYPEYYITIINQDYRVAIITLKNELELTVGDPRFPSIVYLRYRELYTLLEISPVKASGAEYVQSSTPLNLTGNGVTIAIIDTGIDFLCKEFRTLSGETRIDFLWDQTIPSENNIDIKNNIPLPFGTAYSKDDINKAIKESELGLDPYLTVPSKDILEHGTKMATIIGGNGSITGSPGVAPNCNFVIVKLLESVTIEKELNISTPIFTLPALIAAMQLLFDYSIINKIPLIIYLPLGTNSGNHKGNGILEGFIEYLTNISGIIVITGAGNEGARGGHTSGMIENASDTSLIYLSVSPNQNFLEIEIWIEIPDIMTVDVISPAGESTGFTPVSVNEKASYKFIFEKTTIELSYFIPEETSGDELIRINFNNLQPGIWKLRLTPRLHLSGKYNVWITYPGDIIKDTYFSPSDPFGTITNPGTSTSIITVAAYNQNNNNLLDYSGNALFYDFIERIDIAAGGVDALTVAPNNKKAVANGTSVSAAVVTGACALLMEWCIGNLGPTYTYYPIIKFYLLLGTVGRSGDVYPNNQWGYGILNIYEIFKNLF
jgi:subtilisin family serine protease